MRLANFILKNIEPILQKWEDFAKTLTPAADCMDSTESGRNRPKGANQVHPARVKL